MLVGLKGLAIPNDGLRYSLAHRETCGMVHGDEHALSTNSGYNERVKRLSIYSIYDYES